MLRCLALTYPLLFLIGCASVGLDYPPEYKAKAEYSSGTPYVSHRQGPVLLDVGVPPEKQSPSEPIPLIVSVGNLSKKSFNFGPENMTATIGGKPVRIYTFEQLKARADHQANMLMLAAAMGGASQALNASMPTTTYSSGNVYGSTSPSYGVGNSYNYSGSYTGYSSTYNPAASAAANAAIQANTSSRMNDIASTRNQTVSALRESTFRTTTIRPGQVETGLIFFKVPSMMAKEKRITFTAQVAGETITFPVIYK